MIIHRLKTGKSLLHCLIMATLAFFVRATEDLGDLVGSGKYTFVIEDGRKACITGHNDSAEAPHSPLRFITLDTLMLLVLDGELLASGVLPGSARQLMDSHQKYSIQHEWWLKAITHCLIASEICSSLNCSAADSLD